MAIDHKFSNTSAKTVQELLQTKSTFTVPRFQRNYSWNEDRVETLWNDLMDNFKIVQDGSGNSRDAQYLLGPIVLVSDSQKRDSFYVIDGQQRLSTLTMLFCVARDIIREDAEKAKSQLPLGSDKISEYIENTHMNKHVGWKLNLNDTDRTFFREIQEFELEEESQLDRIKLRKNKTQSLKLLADNYALLHGKITDSLHSDFDNDHPNLKDMDEKQKRDLRIKNVPTLLFFMNHVVENNFLIQIMVSDDSSAFQIFETLNERGQTLSKSNLIKNHILNQVKDIELQRELSDRWNKVFDEIVGSNQNDDDFIMESYESRNGDKQSLREKVHSNISMSKKNLYRIIKQTVRDEESCKKFIKELEEDAEFLSMLNEPSEYTYEEGRNDAYAIKALKAKLVRIPLLAAHRKWGRRDTPEDYLSLASLLVKFFFKIRTVRQKHPGKIEDIMFNITKMINGDKSLDKIKQELLTMDDHDDFKYNFKFFVQSPHKDFARYVLQRITIHLGDRKDNVVPLDGLTLEHILPAKYKDTWKEKEFFREYDGDDKMYEFVSELGNLTLLKSPISAKQQSLPFQKKNTLRDSNGNEIGYLGSPLKINKKTVCTRTEWTANIILERGEDFAKYADKIWKLE